MRRAILLVLLAACGSETVSFETFEDACAAVEGCGEGAEPTQPIFRVRVVREDGSYRIESAEVAAASETAMPFGALSGEISLVGRDAGGTPLDGQRMRFPEAIYFENDLEGGRIEETLQGAVSAIGYVRSLPGMVDLALIDASGSELAISSLPSETGTPRGAVFQASSACPHVLLIGSGTIENYRTAGGVRDVEFIEPGPVQRAVVDAALSHAPEMLCNGVARIGFAFLPDLTQLGGQVWTSGVGDLVVINVAREGEGEDEGERIYSESRLATGAERRVRLMRTILHEMAHATDALLGSVSLAEGAQGQWLRSSRGLAAQVVERTRLQQGFRGAWEQMHARFVELGWAEAHRGVEASRDTVAGYDAEQTARAGAMSRYGATTSGDDVADMVSWALLGEAFERAGVPMGRKEREDFACQAMATYEENRVPQRYAAVYAKLRFLRDVGMIEDEHVDRCRGRVNLRDTPEGLRLFTGDEPGRLFDMNEGGTIGTLNGRYVFEFSAEGRAAFDGTDYPATARFVLDLGASADTEVERISWPRGIFRLGDGAPNTFSLRLDGAEAGNFDVTDGFVFLAESSNQRINGGIVIRQAFRNQAPVPVPQVFDPPLNGLFLLQN